MPLIHCHIPRGLTATQKRALIREIAWVTHSTLEVAIEAVNILISEHAPGDMKTLGVLPADPDAPGPQESTRGPH